MEKGGSEFPLFEEIRRISQISYKYYKVPDPLDNVQTLADEMINLGQETQRYSKLLKDTYSESVVENINLPEIIQILGDLTYENAKIIISSKKILKEGAFPDLQDNEILQEKWMKTKYFKYEKRPINQESEKIAFQLPKQNILIPDCFDILAKEKV